MCRLNQRAWKILRAKVQRCGGSDQLTKIEQEIVIKRLEKQHSAAKGQNPRHYQPSENHQSRNDYLCRSAKIAVISTKKGRSSEF